MMNRIKLLFSLNPVILMSLLVLLIVPVSLVQAEEAAAPVEKPGDRSCLMCHRAGSTTAINAPMEGFHSHVVNPNSQGDINCSDCHGNISSVSAHRSGAKDTIRYKGDMFSVAEKNDACMSCHKPEQLRESFWSHDVHVTKIACADCHKLHPKSDPMKGINHDISAKIKLCVDCHRSLPQEDKRKEKP